MGERVGSFNIVLCPGLGLAKCNLMFIKMHKVFCWYASTTDALHALLLAAQVGARVIRRPVPSDVNKAAHIIRV